MKKVEVMEIWQPVNRNEGEIIRDKKHLKRVVFLVNGVPVWIEEDFMARTRSITVEESKRIRNQLTRKK